MAKKPKRPRDPNQLAHHVMRIAAGEESDSPPSAGKDPAAVSRGKKGGNKGGEARAKKLTPEQRKEIASKAAKKRWSKHTK